MLKNPSPPIKFSLLGELLKIKSVSGEELAMKQFIMEYVTNNRKLKSAWQLIEGSRIQDCLMIFKGKPRVAVFIHMDTVGFMTRYENQLIPIGGPEVDDEVWVTGKDSLGPIDCRVTTDRNGRLYHDFKRQIERGTSLTFRDNFKESSAYIQSPYLDNRIGLFISLLLLESVDDCLFVFSCWEEHGGGSVAYLTGIVNEEFKINQALIADVTWVSDGIFPGKGVVISCRDRLIPRRSYIEKIIKIASVSAVPYQLEIEGVGSSDGGEIQRSPYAVDWCFIGPPVENTHSPNEKVHKKDIISTLRLYQILIETL